MHIYDSSLLSDVASNQLSVSGDGRNTAQASEEPQPREHPHQQRVEQCKRGGLHHESRKWVPCPDWRAPRGARFFLVDVPS